MMQLDLNQLTESERDAILNVIRRDEDLRNKDQDRVRNLQTEIKQLKLKGVLRDGQDSETTCARCREKFGFIFNKGAICPNCKHKICDKCQVPTADSWLCVLCSKQKELDAMSNQWFYSKFRASKRKPKSKQVLTGTEMVKSSITNTPIAEESGGDSGNTLSEEVKRVLTNNNALAPNGRQSEAECSDTQSMESVSPRHLSGGAEQAAFPQEEDKKLLMELIRPRPRNASPNNMDPHRVQVRRVRTKKYQDSDSSSGSEASSPMMSSRNESMFTKTDSIRSSLVSSEGRITMVTDTLSDLDYPISESNQPSPRSLRAASPMQRSPNLSHKEIAVNGRSRSPSPSNRSQRMDDKDSLSDATLELEKASSDPEGQEQDEEHNSPSPLNTPSSLVASDASGYGDNDRLTAVKQEEPTPSGSPSPSSHLTASADIRRKVDELLTKYSHTQTTADHLAMSMSEQISSSEDEEAPPPALPNYLSHPLCSWELDDPSDCDVSGGSRSIENRSPWEDLEVEAATLMAPASSTEEVKTTLLAPVTSVEAAEVKVKEEEDDDDSLLFAYCKSAVPRKNMVIPDDDDDEEDSLSIISERTEPDEDFEMIDANSNVTYGAHPLDIPAPSHPSVEEKAASITFESPPTITSTITTDEQETSIPRVPAVMITTEEYCEADNAETLESEQLNENRTIRVHTVSESSVGDHPPLERRDTLGTLVGSQDSLNLPTSDLDDDLDVILEQNKDFVSEAELQDIMREIAERKEADNGSMSKQVIEELKQHLQNRARQAGVEKALSEEKEEPESKENELTEGPKDTTAKSNELTVRDGPVDTTPISPIHDLQKKFDQPPKYFGSGCQPIPEPRRLETEAVKQEESESNKQESTETDTKEEEKAETFEVTKEVTFTDFTQPEGLSSTVTETVCVQKMEPVECAAQKTDSNQPRDKAEVVNGDKPEAVNTEEEKATEILEETVIANAPPKQEISLETEALPSQSESKDEEPAKLPAEDPAPVEEEVVVVATAVVAEAFNSQEEASPSEQSNVPTEEVSGPVESEKSSDEVSGPAQEEPSTTIQSDVPSENVSGPVESNESSDKESSPLEVTVRVVSEETSSENADTKPSTEDASALEETSPSMKEELFSQMISSIDPTYSGEKATEDDQKSVEGEISSPPTPLTPPSDFKDESLEMSGDEAEDKENAEEDKAEENAPAKSSSFETVYEDRAAESNDAGTRWKVAGTTTRGGRGQLHTPMANGRVRAASRDQHQQSVRDVFRALRSLSVESRLNISSSSDEEEAALSISPCELAPSAALSDSIHVTVGDHSVRSDPCEWEAPASPAPSSKLLMPNAIHHRSTPSFLDKISQWETTPCTAPNDSNNLHNDHPYDSPNRAKKRKLSTSLSPSRQPRLGTSSFIETDRSPPPVTTQTRVITSVESARKLSLLDPNPSHQCDILPSPTDSVSDLESNPVKPCSRRSSPVPSPSRSRPLVHPAFTRKGSKRSIRSLRSSRSSMHSTPSSAASSPLASPLHGPLHDWFKNITATEANGFLAPPVAVASEAASQPAEDVPDSASIKEPHHGAESPVPSIAVTCPEKTSIHSHRSEDNIDEAFALQTHTDNAPDHNTSNLLSPHSASRESLASFYSDAGDGVHGKIPVSGEIQFALEYNYKLGVFEVHVKACRDLAPADVKKKRSDPYVKTYLLPDKSKTGKRKTKVKKNNLSPNYDEILKYQLTKSELETRTLWITVWSYGNFGRNDFLGEVTVPLDYYHFTDTNPKWHKLLDRPASKEDDEGNPAVGGLAYKGDLEVAMKYITPENIPNRDKSKKTRDSRGELQVMIKGAKNLTAVRANGFSDAFCKGYLLPERSSKVKKKTPVIKKNVNPLWNHNFIFENLAWEDLKERCLELTVWDHDRLTSNDFLGGVRISLGTGKSAEKEVDWMDSTGKEITMWQKMLDAPNYWIEDTLPLRPSMSGRQHRPR